MVCKTGEPGGGTRTFADNAPKHTWRAWCRIGKPGFPPTPQVPAIKDWLERHNFTGDDGYSFFVKKAADIALAQGRRPVQWVEVFDHFGSALDKRTVVHVWKDKSTLTAVVKAGTRKTGGTTIFQDRGTHNPSGLWVIFLISSTHLHVGAHRTWRRADAIELTAAHSSLSHCVLCVLSCLVVSRRVASCILHLVVSCILHLVV